MQLHCHGPDHRVGGGVLLNYEYATDPRRSACRFSTGFSDANVSTMLELIMPTVPLPTSSWRRGDPAMMAVLVATLSRGNGGALRAASKEAGEAGLLLVWPAGFFALSREDGRAEVYNADGQLSLSTGDLFRVGGGVQRWRHGESGPAGVQAFLMNAWPFRLGPAPQFGQ